MRSSSGWIRELQAWGCVTCGRPIGRTRRSRHKFYGRGSARSNLTAAGSGPRPSSDYGRTTRLRSPSNINDVVPVAFLVLSHRPSLCQHGLMTDCGQSCSIPEHIHQFLVSRWWFGGRQLSWRWTPLKQEPQRQDQEQLALQVAVARVLRVARLLFRYDGILCVLGLPRCFHPPPFRTEPPGFQKQAAGKVVKCVA